MTTDSHSDVVLPFDIFIGYAHKKQHYFVCVYSQDADGNNPLTNDIFGVIVTTNPKYRKMTYNDYNVPIIINRKQSYACCDKMYRFKKEDINKKHYKLDSHTMEQIKEKTTKFFAEVKRQMEGAIEKW